MQVFSKCTATAKRRKLKGIPLRTPLQVEYFRGPPKTGDRAARQKAKKFPKVHKASNMTGKQRELPRNTYQATVLKTERDFHGL